MFELELRHPGTDDNKLDLGDGLMISTGSSGVSFTFRCEYPVHVSVTSERFYINDASVSSTQSAVGNLAAGFSLTLSDGNDVLDVIHERFTYYGRIVLGSMLNVKATWDIEIENVWFYFRNCKVEQGGTLVSIIKDGCFSDKLKVKQTSEEPLSPAFQMMTFNIVGEEGNMQYVVCDIKLCDKNKCDKPENNHQCPQDDQYEYSITG